MVPYLAGLILFPFWIVAGDHQMPAPDPATGKKIYLDRCKVCHGIRGEAKSFAANALHPPPRNFTSDKSKKELTRKRMIQSVTEGREGTAMMPWKNNLSPREIQAVVQYIRHELMGLPE